MSAQLLLSGFKNFALNYDTLYDRSQPSRGGGQQPEAQPWVLFDYQTYPAAGVSSLAFFQSATAANASDPTLSNFANGTLNAKYYFEIGKVFTILQAMPTANAGTTNVVTGAANDVSILHKSARGNLNATLNSRPYFGFPLGFFGRPGGPVTSYTAFGSGTVADNQLTTGDNQANGGFPVDSNLVIPPATQFGMTMLFNKTAISVDMPIVVAMMGILHRPL